MGAKSSSLVEASSPSVTGRPVVSPNPLLSDALSSLQSLSSIKDITFLPDSSGYRETNVCWNFDAIGSPSVIFTPRSEQELKSILEWYQSFPALWTDHGLSIHAGGHSHYALKNHSIVIHLKHFNKKELNKETKIGTFGAGLKLVVIIRQYRDHFLSAPRELGLMIALPCGGPLVFPFCYTGDNLEEGQKLMKEVTKIGSPVIKKVFQSKYAVEKNSLQWSADEEQKPGNWYEAGIILKEFSDDVINILLKYTSKQYMPNTESQLLLAQLGGKIDEIKENETAFLGRNAPFWLVCLGKWSNCKSSDDYLSERNKAKQWVKNLQKELIPWTKAGTYQTLGEQEVSEPKKQKNSNNNNNNNNSQNNEEKTNESDINNNKNNNDTSSNNNSDKNDIEITPEWYGINYARLVEIKRKYDPKNIFRHNKNIDPDAKI